MVAKTSSIRPHRSDPGRTPHERSPSARSGEGRGKVSSMTRNLVYIVAVVLAVTSAVFGYQLWRERQKTEGVEIRVDDHGISIEKR